MEEDALHSDVIVFTHMFSSVPISEHDSVSAMGSPVDMNTVNENEIDPFMDAIFSIVTAKDNRIGDVMGFAITTVIKKGCILRLADGRIDILHNTTRIKTDVICIATEGMAPYGGGNSINNIPQPYTAIDVAVIGVAIPSERVVPWSSAWAMHMTHIAAACTFCTEIAKSYRSMKLELF